MLWPHQNGGCVLLSVKMVRCVIECTMFFKIIIMRLIVLYFTFILSPSWLAVSFVHPRLAFVIADEKDLAGCVTGMFSGANCQRPCNMCLTSFHDESLVEVGERRSLSFMRDVRNILLILFFITPAFYNHSFRTPPKRTHVFYYCSLFNPTLPLKPSNIGPNMQSVTPCFTSLDLTFTRGLLA